MCLFSTRARSHTHTNILTHTHTHTHTHTPVSIIVPVSTHLSYRAPATHRAVCTNLWYHGHTDVFFAGDNMKSLPTWLVTVSERYQLNLLSASELAKTRWGCLFPPSLITCVTLWTFLNLVGIIAVLPGRLVNVLYLFVYSTLTFKSAHGGFYFNFILIYIVLMEIVIFKQQQNKKHQNNNNKQSSKAS